jgi:hypothetical protein
MNTSELQYEKISLINWITRLQDEVIIAQLKKIQSSTEEVEFPYLTEEDIVIQAEVAEQEIKLGKTLSHDDAYKEFKKWK